jgi:hypothetical protein
MFPISKVDLSFLEIADYWSREMQPPESKWKLLDILICAWWRGEIIGDAPPRLEFLKKMFAKRSGKDELSGIVFKLEGEVGEPTEIKLPDGSLDVDIRPRIPVPSRNTDEWDEAKCDPAFQSLGSEIVSCVDHYDDWLPGFGWFNLSHDEFMKWLATQGYSLPTFWRGNQAGGAAVGAMTGAAKGPHIKASRGYDCWQMGRAMSDARAATAVVIPSGHCVMAAAKPEKRKSTTIRSFVRAPDTRRPGCGVKPGSALP